MIRVLLRAVAIGVIVAVFVVATPIVLAEEWRDRKRQKSGSNG